MQEYLEACKAVTTHGVAGEVKVELWCDSAAFLSGFSRLYRGPQGQNPIGLVKVRPHKNMALLTLEGVHDPETARELVGTVFYIARAEAKLPRGHYFQADLIGRPRVDAASGRIYGVITAVTRPAAQDIYTVRDETGAETLFPAVQPILPPVDPDNGRELADPHPAMFTEAANGDRPGACVSPSPPSSRTCASRSWTRASWAGRPARASSRPIATRSGTIPSTARNRWTTTPTAAAAAW